MNTKYESLEKGQLINLVERLESRKRYGIVWDEEISSEENLALHANSYPYLKYHSENSIVKGEDAPNFLLIEGDNYHALTSLYYSHKKSVDLIYIDPPYNMGDKNFAYNDNYVDKTDSIDIVNGFRLWKRD